MDRSKLTQPGSSRPEGGWLTRVGGFVTWLLRPEDLPLGPSPAQAPDGPRFLQWLLASETLPEIAPGSKTTGRPFAAWLFASERLPGGGSE